MIIIYPPTLDWGWMKQRPQQLMTCLARNGHTVFFCNPSWSEPRIEEVEPRLFVVRQFERWLREDWPAYRSQQAQQEQVTVWCSFPKLASTLQQFDPDYIVYDCVDEFAQWAPYEAEMVRTADAIICTSERLFANKKRSSPGKKLALIRNAYDKDMMLHIDSLQPAGEVNNDAVFGRPPIERGALSLQDAVPIMPLEREGSSSAALKRAVYIGAWAPWVDDMLLRRLADAIPDVEVLVIGPEFGKPFPRHVPNKRLRFLGLKPHAELAHYIRQADVLLLPFRIMPVTLSTNPVKLYEYLAAGKPVVSTALPEARLLQPEVDVAATHGAFIELVRHRLQHPGDASARTALALKHTWEHRAAQAEALLKELTR
ncbi:glycosyltransferase [Paenibacillus sp. TAB 01]|uniref:glycosyltransferase family protein n=1 Tax=Paenibacillus sp. TAB 01 TaxID=3368988 RepID=UPI0037501F4F